MSVRLRDHARERAVKSWGALKEAERQHLAAAPEQRAGTLAAYDAAIRDFQETWDVYCEIDAGTDVLDERDSTANRMREEWATLKKSLRGD